MVDDENCERVSARWRHINTPTGLTVYARTSLDGNGLKYQRQNLRLVDHASNTQAGVARRVLDRYESKL